MPHGRGPPAILAPLAGTERSSAGRLRGTPRACQGRQQAPTSSSPRLLSHTFSSPTHRHVPALLPSCLYATSFHFKADRSFCRCPAPKSATNSSLSLTELLTYSFLQANSSAVLYASIVIAILEILPALHQSTGCSKAYYRLLGCSTDREQSEIHPLQPLIHQDLPKATPLQFQCS